MTVRSQLFAGFGALVLITVLTGTVAVWSLDSTVRAGAHTAELYSDEAARVGDVRYLAEHMVAASRAYLLSGEPRDREEFERSRTTLLDHMRELRQYVETHGSDRFDWVEALSDTDAAVFAYGVSAERAMERRASARSADAAVPLFESTVVPARSRLDSALNAFLDEERAAFRSGLLHSERVASRSSLALVAASLLAVLLSVVLALSVLRSISRAWGDTEAALETARRAAAAREEVLAIVSHDLRTPLNAVVLGAGLLRRNPQWLGGEAPRITASLEGAAEHMRALVDELVDSVRLESGRMALDPKPASAARLVHDVARLFELRADASAIRLDVQANTPAFVRVDRERILQVLSNLVGNAVKFTPVGGTVRIRAVDEDEQVRFEVTDTGRGIEPGEVPRVFERHWQAERGERHGLGLGLYIAQSIVALHGGTISVASSPGTGSTFSFALARVARVGGEAEETQAPLH